MTSIQKATSQDARINQMRRESTVLGPMNKILVANRGEIPIRIFRTAHELSMQTVAIYSHEDRLSMHRLKADESYVIGKRTIFPVGAYLQIDEIIQIALKHNVNMIHPGYGFLSENSEFARKVEENGLIWIGPSYKTIDSVGDKVSARTLAIENDVPVVPGTPGPIESVDEAKNLLKNTDYQLLLKLHLVVVVEV